MNNLEDKLKKKINEAQNQASQKLLNLEQMVNKQTYVVSFILAMLVKYTNCLLHVNPTIPQDFISQDHIKTSRCLLVNIENFQNTR